MIESELIKRIIRSIILIPLVIFFVIKGSFFFNSFIFICFLISVYEWINMSKKYFYQILGTIFLIVSFYSIFKIRNIFDNDYSYLLFVLIVCINTDIGGYLFGKLFKGPKLTSISPNKTYAGMFGSFILPLISIYLLINLSMIRIFFNFDKKLFFFIVLISLVSQLGDILISYFKRQSNIKDTGNIIPGHGGILDRIDGMIFTFPFAYLIFLNWDF